MKRIISLAILFACALSAQAGLETFFGEYVSPYPVDGINQVPRPTNIVAVVDAQSQFYSRLSDVLIESFEDASVGSTPSTIYYGTNTATLSGSHTVVAVPEATNTYTGIFPGTGTNCLALTASGSTYFTLTFSSPQSAFSFFGTDIEVNQLSVTLVSTNGSRRDVTPPVTVPQGSAGAFFFGVIDKADPFNAVEFRNIGNRDDTFGFDDMTIAMPEQVLPPDLSIRVSHVEICWDTVSNEVYQLQYSSSLTTNAWVPFGGTVVGDGSRYCTNDSILQGGPQRFYRLVFTNSP